MIAHLLIERGADVNTSDKLGRTPLMGAAVRGLMEMVTLLVSKGVDARALDKEGRSAAGYAAIAGEQAVVKYFQTLKYELAP